MTCAQVRVQLAAYQEGGLRPVQRRAVAEHIAACALCQAELISYEQGDRALRRLTCATPSEVILQGVLQRVAREDLVSRRRKAHLARSVSGWLNMVGAVSAAGVVGAVLVTLVQGLHGGTWGSQTALGSRSSYSPALASLTVQPSTTAGGTVATQALHLAAGSRTRVSSLVLREGAAALSAIRKSPNLYYLHTGDQTQFLQGNTQAPIMRVGLLDTEDRAVTIVPTPGIYTSVSVSPDGKRLAYGVYSPEARSVWRGISVRDSLARTMAMTLTMPGDSPAAQVKTVRWAADGRHLIYSVQTISTVIGYVADVATRRSVKAYSGWWPSFNQVLSPNLRLLAEAGDRPDPAYYDKTITVGAVHSTKRWNVGRGMRPVWSPDSHHIAYLAGPMSTTLTLWVVDADGHHKRQLTAKPQQISQVAWSPDGQAIAYAVADNGQAPGASSQIYVVPLDHPDGALPGLRTRWIGDMVWVPSPQKATAR